MTVSIADLHQFTGTEHYYKHFTGLVYTDGVKFLADNAECHWLIDAIASYQNHPKLKDETMQFWTLETDGKAAKLYVRQDKDCPKLIEQVIEHTDFPFQGKFDHLWLQHGSLDGVHPAKVLMLRSEY